MLAEAALRDTLAAVSRVHTARRLLVLDGEPGPWLPSGFDVVPQRGAGLAERLAGAFDAVDGPALLIGMDTPQVTPGLLRACGRALLAPGVDAVLGAAADGGYWAIGLRRPDPSVFEDVPMSIPATGAAQRRRLHQLGLATAELPRLRDVDTYTDALAVAAAAPLTRFRHELRRAAARRAA